MKHETGNWRVTRRCCTSGNCSDCTGETTGKGFIRMVQIDKCSQPYAEFVAKDWQRYEGYEVRAEPSPS